MIKKKGSRWNPEHLEVVREGAEAIRQWRKRHPGGQLELVGVKDLAGAKLARADLSGSNLAEANLVRADLAGADLRNATLDRADLSDADLTAAFLSGSSLCGARLRGADIRGANLRDAEISHADLSSASLVDADLTGVNLASSDLSNATLKRANLKKSNLCEANLSDASLEFAYLGRANLASANLSRAELGWAVLTNCNWEGAVVARPQMRNTIIGSDLTAAAVLDVFHGARSKITSDCLLRATRRPWPIEFLRGVGLSNAEIDFARSMSSNALDFYSAFISYSAKGEDDRFAVKLHDALQVTGVRCWLDKHEVDPGDDVLERINEGVRLWDKVLLVCSRQSLKSHWVRREVERAFQKEKELEDRHGKRILCIMPIDLDGYLFSRHCTFKFTSDLRERHAAKFRGWQDDESIFDTQLERVVKALRSGDMVRPPPPTSKLG